MLILGRGSDIVIADGGVRGLVIQVRAEGTEVAEDRLVAESGVPMARAATVTQGAGLSGLEFGLAIPGTVGGAVWANAGAHESDVRAILESALVMGADGREVRLDGDGLGLGYRDSRLKHRSDPAAPPEVVVSATFRLSPATPDEIRERLDEIRRWRQAHQPLGIPSAGSYFRNPPGDSAGRLIEAAGLKGAPGSAGRRSARSTPTSWSTTAKGTADDVRRLGERVRAEVATRFGVELEPEVVFVGDWGPAWPRRGRAAGRPGGPPDDRRPPADRRPPRWSVRRARRVDRIGQRHRRRPGRPGP